MLHLFSIVTWGNSINILSKLNLNLSNPNLNLTFRTDIELARNKKFVTLVFLGCVLSKLAFSTLNRNQATYILVRATLFHYQI